MPVSDLKLEVNVNNLIKIIELPFLESLIIKIRYFSPLFGMGVSNFPNVIIGRPLKIISH
jgi:hypothetical protein